MQVNLSRYFKSLVSLISKTSESCLDDPYVPCFLQKTIWRWQFAFPCNPSASVRLITIPPKSHENPNIVLPPNLVTSQTLWRRRAALMQQATAVAREHKMIKGGVICHTGRSYPGRGWPCGHSGPWRGVCQLNSPLPCHEFIVSRNLLRAVGRCTLFTYILSTSINIADREFITI